MKMDKRILKELTGMINDMDYSNGGMKMDRRVLKELTKMVN